MHGHAYEALLEHEGIVVAHDARLSGLYQPYAERANPPTPTAGSSVGYGICMAPRRRRFRVSSFPGARSARQVC